MSTFQPSSPEPEHLLPELNFPVLDIQTEVLRADLERLKEHGESCGWPTNPNPDLFKRFFEDDAAVASSCTEILSDLVRYVRVSPNGLPVTDLRGSGYYGPFHEQVVAEHLKEHLRKEVPHATKACIAAAVTNALPLFFVELIALDLCLDNEEAVTALVNSRAYGLSCFPAALHDLPHLIAPVVENPVVADPLEIEREAHAATKAELHALQASLLEIEREAHAATKAELHALQASLRASCALLPAL